MNDSQAGIIQPSVTEELDRLMQRVALLDERVGSLLGTLSIVVTPDTAPEIKTAPDQPPSGVKLIDRIREIEARVDLISSDVWSTSRRLSL